MIPSLGTYADSQVMSPHDSVMGSANLANLENPPNATPLRGSDSVNPHGLDSPESYLSWELQQQGDRVKIKRGRRSGHGVALT